MNGHKLSATGMRILLLIWGFGIALMLAVVLMTDLQASLRVTDTVAQLQPPEEKNMVQFPFRVPGTALTVEYLAAYDGAFVEDGTDREMTDIMAAMVYNSSDREIEEATVTLEDGQQTLEFYTRCIPAGARVLVLERSAALYRSATYATCTAMTAENAQMALTPQQLQIRETGMGTLTLTNLTGETMKQITVYYKTCAPDGSFYLGGITYTVQVEDLRPSQTVTLTPYHYAAGYSSIIKATETPI